MKTTINTNLSEADRKEREETLPKALAEDRKRRARVKRDLRKRDLLAADYVDEFLKICPTFDSDVGHVLAGAEMMLMAVGGEENIHPVRRAFVSSVFKELLIRYYELETEQMMRKRVAGKAKRKENMAETLSKAVSEAIGELIKQKSDEKDKKKGDPMYG